MVDREREEPKNFPDQKRYYLSEANGEKINKIAAAMNVSPSAVVNAIIGKLSEIDVREMMTFRIEIRSDEKTPGRTVRIKRSGGFSITL